MSHPGPGSNGRQIFGDAGPTRPFVRGDDTKLRTARKKVECIKKGDHELLGGNYLGVPADNLNLATAWLILPENMVPMTLIADTKFPAFNAIRKAMKVFVWKDKTSPIVHVAGASAAAVREALSAINWTIQDLRAKEVVKQGVYLVQPPRDSNIVTSLIKMSSGGRDDLDRQKEYRPTVLNGTTNRGQVLPLLSMTSYTTRFCSLFVDAAKTLAPIRQPIRLRVHFSKLKVTSAMKGATCTYMQFIRILDSGFEGTVAYAEPNIMDGVTAASIIQSMGDQTSRFRKLGNGGPVAHIVHNVVLQVQNSTVEVDVDFGVGQSPRDKGRRHVQLSGARAFQKTDLKYMSIVSASPDRPVDWNIEARVRQPTNRISAHIEDIIRGIEIKEGRDIFDRPLPQLKVIEPSELRGQIHATSAIMLTRYQYLDTPYVVEFSETRKWDGVKTDQEPQCTIGVALYNTCWDEGMQAIGEAQDARDWGKNMEYLLPGKPRAGIESRFGEFLGHVLDVQGFLCARLS